MRELRNCQNISYFDATGLAEFLHAKTAETVRKDLREELDFVAVYDAALTAVQTILDRPGRRASLLVRLCLQNGGMASKAKQGKFGEISDGELAGIERAIQGVKGDRAVVGAADALWLVGGWPAVAKGTRQR